MAHIILPHRWRQQPQGPAAIDPAHPLARGLTCAYVLNNRLPADASPRRRHSVSTTASVGNGPAGRGLLFSGMQTLWLADGAIPSGLAGPKSQVAFVRFGGGDARTISMSAAGETAAIQWRLHGGDHQLVFSQVDVAASVAGAPTAGKDIVTSFSWAMGATLGGGGAVYNEGRLQGAFTQTTLGAGSTANPMVGARASDGNQGFNGLIYEFLAYDRLLSAGEHQALAENPWQIFRPVRRRIWVSGGSAGQTYNESLTEVGSAADAPTSTLVASATLSEAANATDAPGSTQIATGGISESASASDAVSGALVAGAALTEAATASDAPGSTIVAGAGVSEAATAIDAPAADTQAVAALTEVASAADALSTVLVAASSITELASAADAPASTAVMAASVSESASASDAVTGGIGAQTHDVSLSEAASATDALNTTAVLGVAITEAVAAGDSTSSIGTFAQDISETASAADGVDGSIGASTYNVSISESAVASDAVSNTATLVAGVAEAAVASDSHGNTGILVAQATEVATAGDAVSAVLHAVAVLVESVPASDAISVGAELAAALLEAVTASDAYEATIGAQTYHVSITEAAAAADSFVPVAAFGARRPDWRGAVSAGAGRPAAIQTQRRPASRG
ncbi:MAG: hypothetical protein J0H09_29880 [Burkholderiales bacterium]|nr:hypothetical protein [Burkholderiales bacterium]